MDNELSDRIALELGRLMIGVHAKDLEAKHLRAEIERLKKAEDAPKGDE
jgi:hypothetical protein